MARVTIIGDGPGGLSAALFLAKNDQDVKVFGQDETAMNYAYLYNYLGIPEIDGTEFQQIAKKQVASQGAKLIAEEVTEIRIDGGFTVDTGSGAHQSDYLILTEGKSPDLAHGLGVDADEDGAILVDQNYQSSLDRVYVLGRSVRPKRSQAIISAGAGAVAALDILAREEGRTSRTGTPLPRSSEMSQRLEPIACSLPLREAASQAGEWHELAGRAIRVERVEDGISVVYPLHLAAQVEDLVSREAACCAWLSLETLRHSEGIQIRLTSPNPDAQPVIEALVGI